MPLLFRANRTSLIFCGYSQKETASPFWSVVFSAAIAQESLSHNSSVKQDGAPSRFTQRWLQHSTRSKHIARATFSLTALLSLLSKHSFLRLSPRSTERTR